MPQSVSTDAISIEAIRPHIARFAWRGVSGAEDLVATREFVEAMRRELGDDTVIHLLVVVESDQVQFRRGTRRALLDLGRARLWSRTAVVGAPYPIKVAIELLRKGMSLLFTPADPTRFFDTEQEALAWLLEDAPG